MECGITAARFPAQEAATPSAAGESIAVLPFANLSPEKDNEFFADGIADEIISVLSRAPGLRVSARSASFSFKGKGIAPKEIARNRLESGLAAHHKANSLNPLRGTGQIAWTLTLLDRHDEAIRVARENFAEHPNSGGARLKEDIYLNANLGWAYGRAGQKDKALATFKRIEALAGRREFSLVLLAFVSAGLDDRDRVMALLGKMKLDAYFPEPAAK